MNNTMCPELYKRLVQVFKNVTIMNPGVATQVDRRLDARTNRRVTEVRDWGEAYAINCPFCHDTKRRLWINHRWVEHKWMCRCFNETGCMAGAEGKANRDKLWKMLFEGGPLPKLPIRATAPAPVIPPALPEDFVSLADLPGDHQAITYLTGRGFDIDELIRLHGVGYCTTVRPNNHPPASRIIIPMTVRGALVGWQARAPFDAPKSGFGADPYPKYYNSQGFPRRTVLYGLEAARAFDLVVVCEGVTDVWRVGAPAVGLLTKTATQDQKIMLRRCWGHGVLVVLLDSDAHDEATQLHRELGGHFKGGAVLVRLPRGSDPGSFPRGMIWGMIRSAASDAGVVLPCSFERVG